jgi:hypothetical protein
MNQFFAAYLQDPNFVQDDTFTECCRLMKNIRRINTLFDKEAIWLGQPAVNH